MLDYRNDNNPISQIFESYNDKVSDMYMRVENYFIDILRNFRAIELEKRKEINELRKNFYDVEFKILMETEIDG